MTDDNQNLEVEPDHDVFDDTEQVQTEEVVETPKEVETPAEEEKGLNETGEKEETEATPAEVKEDEKDQSNKMIPEHRFKAALKDVTDERDTLRQELAQVKATPAPDRATDPDGYDLHMRMETSKAIMSETHTDYDEKIQHYQSMEQSNPYLAQAVAAHPIPAKHAYDIAKKDMEIRELSTLKQSDEWTQFQEFKKQQGQQAKEAEATAKAASEAAKTEEKKVSSTDALSKVPNLNRATDVSSGKSIPSSTDDEELFAGAL